MSQRISICYGTPTDPAAFDDYYTCVHLPIASKVPGLTEFTWGRARSLDSFAPPYYLVANLRFADATTLAAALQSPEMAAAGKDVRNFATGGVTMFVVEEQTATP